MGNLEIGIRRMSGKGTKKNPLRLGLSIVLENNTKGGLAGTCDYAYIFEFSWHVYNCNGSKICKARYFNLDANYRSRKRMFMSRVNMINPPSISSVDRLSQFIQSQTSLRNILLAEEH